MKENISNQEFLKRDKCSLTFDVNLMDFLIKNDNNEKNQEAYNKIITHYCDFEMKEINYTSETTKVYYIVDAYLPRSLTQKLRQVKEKIISEKLKQQKEIEKRNKELDADPTAKQIYNQIEL